MQRVIVLNPKGGSGKSTLATNLAAWWAVAGLRVGLVDLDRQKSSRDWLALRPPQRPPVVRLKVDEGHPSHWPELDRVVLDTPAGVHGKELKQQLKLADILLLPILPSPIDMRAGTRFIEELLLTGRIRRERVRIAVVANRVREGSRAYGALSQFLAAFDLPLLGPLRESVNYLDAAEQGLGVCELAPARVAVELAQWQGLMAWLDR